MDVPRSAVPLVAIVATVACTPVTTPPEPPAEPRPGFSGAAALARLHALMDLPRGLGDPDRAGSIDALVDMLAQAGSRPHTHAFEATDRDGTRYALANVVADFRSDARARFVLATHFDTRPWADEEPDPAAHALPVPGANDGTSGVAVILTLVPILLQELPADVGFSVVLFDGEELGHDSDPQGYCAGSRRLAEHIDDPAFALLRRAAFGIVLDMVGDRDLRIVVEPNSVEAAPDVVEHVWSTARRHGHAAFDDTVRPIGIVDDHKFLTAAGIPSIVIIDREYDAWHTRHDTIDRVDAASLETVGEVLRLSLLSWPYVARAEAGGG
jgi:Zn-dependent M28 family amino/carboxypeptidase